MRSDLHMPRFILIFVSTHFCNEIERCQLLKLWKYILVFCEQWKMIWDLNMSHEKMSGFVSFLLFGLTLLIKPREFNFKSHWNTIFFIRKRDLRFEFVLSNSVWFVLTFVIWVQFWEKVEKYRFLTSLK